MSPSHHQKRTVVSTVNERSDCIVDILEFLEMFSEVEVEFVNVELPELVSRVGSKLFDQFVFLNENRCTLSSS